MNEPSVFNGPEVSMHRDMIHDKYVHKISPLVRVPYPYFTLTHITPVSPQFNPYPRRYPQFQWLGASCSASDLWNDATSCYF